MIDPPYMANPEGIYFHPEDVSGLLFADAVGRLLERAAIRNFNAAYAIRQENYPGKKLDKVVVFDSIKHFWLSYDARSGEITNVDMLTNFVLKGRLLRPTKSGVDHWDWIQCKWLQEAMQPLAHALSDGRLCIVGQKGPAFGPGQPRHVAARSVFKTFQWRVHRIDNRIDVLGADGHPKQTIKNAMVMLPSLAKVVRANPGVNPDVDMPRLKSDRLVAALSIIKKDWGDLYLFTSEKKISLSFRAAHKPWKLTNKDVINLLRRDRGKLAVGRQAGSIR